MMDKLDRLKELVGRYADREVSVEDSLVEDLGIFGDDADDLLSDLCAEFELDVSGFTFARHFPQEGRGIFEPRNRSAFPRLTVRRLYEAIQIGRLVDMGE